MSESKDGGGKSVFSGIKTGSSNVVSGIKQSTEKIASSGSKAISGVASGGSKAIHAISSPIESAVRKTVDKANDSLHGKSSSHSTTSDKELVATEGGITGGNEGSNSSATAENQTQTAHEEVGPATCPNETTIGAPRETHQEEQATTMDATSAGATLDEAKPGFLGNVENMANKIFVAPVRGAAGKVAEGGNKLFVNPVKDASKKAKDVLHINSKGASRGIYTAQKEEEVDIADVPPDETLKKMDIIINKQLKDVSIQDYYATAWSEGDGTNKPPLYGPWLKDSGKEKITVGKWEFAAANTDFLGEWDGEKYNQKRTVSFEFNKQIPFQMGPTLAKVKHTHYCRVEANDKCVLAMTIDMSGVPYSDCFKVEIRWVATRSGKSDLAIQVGLFVNFVKSTIMAGKIRSGTTDQTTQQQVQLFRAIKEACGADSAEVVEKQKDKEQDTSVGRYQCSWLSNVLPFMHKDALAGRDDEIAISAKSADKKMKEVITVLRDKDPSDTDPDVLNQLVVVNEDRKSVV